MTTENHPVPQTQTIVVPRPANLVGGGTFFASFAPSIAPSAVRPDALHGPAGRFVQLVAPHTEADAQALLVQFLVFAGNCFGRNCYVTAEADRHFANLFACLIGDSAKGRKGTSLGHVQRLFRAVDPNWVDTRNLSGLSSGEGLIHAVRDPPDNEGAEGAAAPRVRDNGVSDKRLLVVESEFAQVLRQVERSGNTLSPLIRSAWDDRPLETLTKNSPERATNAHISLVGHITSTELQSLLQMTDVANGFANRFLWPYSRRSKLLPRGGNLDPYLLRKIEQSLLTAKGRASRAREVERTPAYWNLWDDLYPILAAERLGLAGAMTSRAESQVLRLSLVYALLDGADQIDRVHLLAALAVWDYCEASVKFVFGPATGNVTADRIDEILQSHPDGIARTEISEQFKRHAASHQITGALALLQRMGRAHALMRHGNGRPAEVWFPGSAPAASITESQAGCSSASPESTVSGQGV